MLLFRLKRACIYCLPVALVAGCGGKDSIACTQVYVPGVSLTLTSPSQVVSTCDAQIIVTSTDGENGVYAEYPKARQTQQFSGCNYSFAYERAGTYQVEITLLEHNKTEIEDIVVTEDECHVQTVVLTQELTPGYLVCPEGYQLQNTTCTTPNGCEFPLFEREVIPGVPGVESTYDCVDACEDIGEQFYQPPEAPGRCASLPLP